MKTTFAQRLSAFLLACLSTTQLSAQPIPPTRTADEASTASQAPNVRPAELEAVDPETMVDELILVDMGPHQVLELLETLTDKVILRRQDIPAAKINFNSRGPLTQSEAVLALESLLTLNSIMLTDMGGKFMKAVPATEVNRHVPEMLTGTTLGLPASQQIYAKLFHLNYLNAQQASGTLVANLVSQNSSFVVFEKANAILITDALINLQRIESMLTEADFPQSIREEIQFVKLNFIQAGEMQNRLENLIKGPLKAYLEGSTSVTADERTNQLIIITHPENMKVIQQVIDSIDIDAAPLTRSEVFPLRQAKAEEVVPIIENIISGQEEGREEDSKVSLGEKSNAPANNTPPTAPQAPAPTNTTASTSTDANSSLQFSNFVGLSADERTNAIVAYGTPSDLRTIAELIDKIDIPLPQVRIEVIITEVTLEESQASGFSVFNLSYSDRIVPTDTAGIPATIQKIPGTGPIGVNLDSFDVAAQVGNFAINAVYDLAEGDNAINILSAPTIIVSHNEEGKINVSQSRPFETASTTNTNNSNALVTNQVEYRDVGIQLTVTPLIGVDGSVTMEIEQTVDNVFQEADPNEDGVDRNPVIGKREANSTITVNNKDVIILGGLQDNQRNVSRTYFPIIGRIPVIGNFFNSVSVDYDRTELIIFVRPTILRNPAAATEVTENMLNVLEEGPQVRKYIETGAAGQIYMEGSKYTPYFEDTINPADNAPDTDQ